MFWKKKAVEPQSPTLPARGVSMDSPRPQPILKAASDQRGGPSIRFAGAASTQVQPQQSPQYTRPSPTAGPSNLAARPHTIMMTTPPPTATASPAIQRIQAPRRSSRPTSPSATSFGARIPPGPFRQSGPLSTPPLAAAAHVTTPPAAYVSNMHARAAPPPSPYRPTSERRVSPLGEFRGAENLAARPPRISSLFETPSAPGRYVMALGDRTPKGYAGEEEDDEHLPTFNIIPATPQTMGDEWPMRRSASGPALERAFPLDDMVDIPLETSASAPMIQRGMETIEEGITGSDSLPAIADLEFSPFDMNVSLPSMESGSSISSLPYSLNAQRQSASYTAPLLSNPQIPPQEPLPSPPFESYPSLPSLDSERSLPSSASQTSLRSSASTSSLASYSDVEEALGSMLASLSDPSMPPTSSMPRMDKVSKQSNPGLGLGLSLPPSASITAPLSPRRKGPPPALDLTYTTRESAGPDMQSAPARINHRVAFYTTARAAPNSSTSGTFSNSSHSSHSHTEFIIPSPPRSDSVSSLLSDETQTALVKDVGGWRDSMRSSISCGSEASDDDPYMASIVCLKPVQGGVAALCREEEYLAESALEVGLAM